MSSDSIGSWRQAATGTITDDITPSYTALMKLSQLMTGSPSALTLGQQALLASSVVAVATSLVHIGVRRWLVGAVATPLLCSPMVGAFSVSLWKDVPYSAALLYCGASLVWLTTRWRQGTCTPRACMGPLVALLTSGLAAVVIRQNGVFFVIGVAGMLLVVLRGSRRAVLAGAAVLVLTLVALKLVIYPVIGVRPAPPQLNLASVLHDLGAVAHHHPETLSTESRQSMERLAPIDQWSRNYSCYTVNPLYYRSGMRFDHLAEDSAGLRKAWLEAVVEQPGTIAGHRLCAASVAWRPVAVDRDLTLLYTVSTGIDPNGDGLATTPLWEPPHRLGLWLIGVVNNPDREWYLWRAPTWIYLCYGALLIAAVRNRSAWLLLPGAALLAQQVGVAVLNPAQDARYMMGSLMLAVLLLPLASVRPRDRATVADAVTTAAAAPAGSDGADATTGVREAPGDGC